MSSWRCVACLFRSTPARWPDAAVFKTSPAYPMFVQSSTSHKSNTISVTTEDISCIHSIMFPYTPAWNMHFKKMLSFWAKNFITTRVEISRLQKTSTHPKNKHPFSCYHREKSHEAKTATDHKVFLYQQLNKITICVRLSLLFLSVSLYSSPSTSPAGLVCLAHS